MDNSHEQVELLELLVASEDAPALERTLKSLEGVDVEKPIQSRDAMTMGVAVLTVAANSLVLISELIKLKAALKGEEESISITVRNVDGEEVALRGLNRETLQTLLGGS